MTTDTNRAAGVSGQDTGQETGQGNGQGTDQSEVIAFLRSPAAHDLPAPADVVETHGALVFLAGENALKIKRAVRYDYLDFSTLPLREAMLRRELALNAPAAPTIYRDVVPVTRDADGTLVLGGTGQPVEWVLRMRRFARNDELTVIAETGGLDDALADDLGHAVQGYHAMAPRRDADGAALIGDILDELDDAFATMRDALGGATVTAFHTASRSAFDKVAALLRARSRAGHVRRCHGDLHLGNLVLIDGKPVPFDALEFSEVLGTCDVLYDLAFLIMDLRHRDLQRAANIVLNGYLLAASGAQDDGLGALPLFLAVRAAIRAMVLVQTDLARDRPGHSDPEARQYLEDAIGFLAPLPARLIAVGGLSGTGKTTLARQLAPAIGLVPGAVHLRSDLERKAMLGVDAHSHLAGSHYTGDARARVYRQMLNRAAVILGAGHSVLLDATFLKPEWRDAAAALAETSDVAFTGLWLHAAPDILLARVAARTGDASDADAGVLRAQLARDPGAPGWHMVNTGASAAAALAAARSALGLPPVRTAAR